MTEEDDGSDGEIQASSKRSTEGRKEGQGSVSRLLWIHGRATQNHAKSTTT